MDIRRKVGLWPTYATLIFFFSFVLCQAPAKADHLPNRLLAAGKPEITLAGINLKTSKLHDVIRMYGQPTRKMEVPNNPAWVGYVWELPNAKVELGVSHGSWGTQIDDIYVEGAAKGQLGSTGRGLKLGDNISTLKRIYGSRFMLRTLRTDLSQTRMEFTGVTVANQSATIQWRSEDFTLTVGFDDKEKVIAMWLIKPECYPGGCE